VPTYAKASSPVHALIESVIAEFHPELDRAKARIGAVMAHPSLDGDGEPTGPAVTLHGEPCLATIRINRQKDRVDGKPDATITIDAEAWKEMADEPGGEARMRALIDHELYHLIVQVDEDSGRAKTDDQGRPLFKMRKHDWTFAGFRVIAERHRSASQEVIQARQLHDSFGNILFGFMEEPAAERASLVERVAARVNAGALGPDITATVTRRARRKADPAGATA
jgi:hypothetical protein